MIKLLTQKVAIEHWKLRALLEQYQLPSGKTTGRLIVESGVRPIIVVPLTDNGRVVIVRQYRFASQEYVWEFPGGLVDGEETPHTAAKRELEEETGYTSDTFIRVGQRIWLDPTLIRIPIDFYVALNCRVANHHKELDFDELIEASRLVDVSELYRMVDAGEIVDAKTLASILLGRKHIDKYCV